MNNIDARLITILVLAFVGIATLPVWGTSIEVKRMITYEEFGAKGDGETDDSEAIFNAHTYANKHSLSIRANDTSIYYIGGADRTTVIKTDTDFGTAQFVIDDTAVENMKAPVFEVRSTLIADKIEGLESISAAQKSIPVSLSRPHLINVTDSNVKHYIRKGNNQNKGSSKTDFFLVDEKGSIDDTTPILWDFERITSVKAYPIDSVTLTVTGGQFRTIANAAESKYTYYNRGIVIKRSNVIVDGIEHRITGEGEQGAPYSGFISIRDCANVTVRNSRLSAHKTYQTIGSAGRPVSMGSYGIQASRAMNVTFENCIQINDIMDGRYWGIMASNYCKNLRYEGCTLSRFDAHKGVYNATIRNSTIGVKGLTLIGHGTFLIENSTVLANRFISLRPDYGSTWTGNMEIRNCIFKPQSQSDTILISGSNNGQHDFGYACTMPETIYIDGLTIEDSKKTDKGPFLFDNVNPQWISETYRQPFPYTVPKAVFLHNIVTTSGRALRISDENFMFKNVSVKEGK